MTVWRLWVCGISVCLMPKFEMCVCDLCLSVINVCLGNDCVALIAVSFLWWDLLSLIPLCGISVCWMAEISLGVCKISAMDECLLDNCCLLNNCLKNVRVCGISVCLMPKFEMSVCDICLFVINVCLGNDCVALISSFDGIVCARGLCAGSLYAEWLSSGCVSRISALYECLFRISDCYVFVMGACRGSLFCMSVCIMYVCRIYILDVCVFDDCLAIVGVRHLCVFNARNLKCLSAECLWSMSVWGMTVWL